MGRSRAKDLHLPRRLFKIHGGYFYADRHQGRQRWASLGRSEEHAVEMASHLNELKRADRVALISKIREVEENVRQSIFFRDQLKCVYCGSAKNLGIDHVIPFSAGGSSSPFNLVTACLDCNSQKGDSDPRDFLLVIAGLRQLIMDRIRNYI